MQETIQEIVELNDVGRIFLDDEGRMVLIATPEYEEIASMKVYDYHFTTSTMGIKELHARTVEKDVEPSHVKEIKPSPEEQKKIDAVTDEVVSVLVFHKGTLQSAGKDVKVKHIRAFAQAVIDSYNKRSEVGEAKDSDFAIVRVNFTTKNIAIQAIE